MSEPIRCNTCIFFDATKDQGVCRINPPVAIRGANMNSSGAFPRVKGESDWCGHHQPDDSAVLSNPRPLAPPIFPRD